MQKTVTVRHFSESNKLTFRRLLSKEMWTDLSITDDLDIKFENFHYQFKHLFDLAFPISILSSFSKVYEKAVLKRLWKFVEKNKIIARDQHGFVKNKNTTSAMFSLIGNIVHKLDSKNPSVELFFDLHKVFDMFDHDYLLNKLNRMGIRGVTSTWLSSFLKSRKQLVEIPAYHQDSFCQRLFRSSETAVMRGVP